MREYFYFDSMITPKIITFIYWLLLAVAGIAGLMMLVSAFGLMGRSFFAGLGMLIVTPIAVVLYAVIARVYCEIMIVMFKMNEALQEIRSK